MNHRTATVKVGLLTIIALTVLITTVIWLRGRGLGGGQSFDVFFKDVDGLREGAPVQLMGIRVGFVDLVSPVIAEGQKYRVKVRFTVTDYQTSIPKGSYISLEQSGIIGEKFVEITPPRSKIYDISLRHKDPDIKRNLPIKVAFRDALVNVGEIDDFWIKESPSVRGGNIYHYQLMYIINKPGYLPPDEPYFELVKTDTGNAYFLLNDPNARLQPLPDKDTYFTLEEPLRLKDFLEQQLASAESLKLTNEKINQLLSDETITTIQGTIKNSERLTAQATKVLEQANHLFASTSRDLSILVDSAQTLTKSVVSVSNNINELAGNPEMQANIQKTVRSVEQSTAALSELLNDPGLKLVLSDAKVTSQNASQLVQYLKTTVVDNDLQGKLNESMTLLSSSLTRLSGMLENLETVTSDQESMKSILENTRDTTENLNRFSERLNKRFLLFRLLF